MFKNAKIAVFLSRTVSELPQLFVQILDTAFLSYPFRGLRDNVRCLSWAHLKARGRLPIDVDWRRVKVRILAFKEPVFKTEQHVRNLKLKTKEQL